MVENGIDVFGDEIELIDGDDDDGVDR